MTFSSPVLLLVLSVLVTGCSSTPSTDIFSVLGKKDQHPVPSFFVPLDEAGANGNTFATRFGDEAVAAWNAAHMSEYQRQKVANYFVLRYSDDCGLSVPEAATAWPSDRRHSTDRQYQRKKKAILREIRDVKLPGHLYRADRREVCEVNGLAFEYLKTGKYAQTNNPKTQDGISNGKFQWLFGKTANGDCERFGCVDREFVDQVAAALAKAIGVPVDVTINDAEARADDAENFEQPIDHGYRLSTVDKNDFVLQPDLVSKNGSTLNYSEGRIKVAFDSRWLATTHQMVAFVVAKDVFAGLSKTSKADGSWTFDFEKTNQRTFDFLRSLDPQISEQEFQQMVVFTRLSKEENDKYK